MIPLPDFIRNHLLLKVFSFALAVLIWLAVNSHIGNLPWNPFKRVDTQDFTLPIKLLVRPGQGQAFRVEPPDAIVRVSADAETLQRLSPSLIHVFVRIDDVKGPMMGSGFRPEVILPKDVALDEIKPALVQVESTLGGFMVFPMGPIN